jgi:DNA-binding Lrp family transcriptional regulator
MRKHNGMRPQDIVILLKIILLGNNKWTFAEMADALQISETEVFFAMERNRVAGLINPEKTQVNRLALRDFLIYGLKYVFPPQIGASTRGIPTAHSASPVKEKIAESTENFVWKYYKGTRRGNAILPLYAKIPQFIENDRELYELLAIVDTLRIGKSREKEIAIEELDKKLNT